MAYTKYSKTPASNNNAPPDGAPEGMLPSGVNDTIRDVMAQIAILGDAVSTSALTYAGSTAGTTTAYTATIGPVLSSFALIDGLSLTIVANATNTGASTLALTATGASGSPFAAKKIFKQTLAGPLALVAGELALNNPTQLTYYSALDSGAGAFVMQRPLAAGGIQLLQRVFLSSTSSQTVTNTITTYDVLTNSFTPQSASSKIVLRANLSAVNVSVTNTNFSQVRGIFYRDSTPLSDNVNTGFSFTATTAATLYSPLPMLWRESSPGTSAVTYAVKVKDGNATSNGSITSGSFMIEEWL